MNYIERDIFVLRDASSVAQPIEYVQGTNAVPILLHIRDYTIPAGSAARVYVEWPSTKGEYDESGVTIDGNDITIEPKDTLFSEVGKCKLQICIVNGEKTLVTFSYPVLVKKNSVPGITEPSKNHSDFLDEYLEKIEEKIEVTTELAEEATTAAQKALFSADVAAQSEANALEHANASSDSAVEAKLSEGKAFEYKNQASISAQEAELSNQLARDGAKNSSKSASESAQSEANSLAYSQSAKEYADQINERIDEAAVSAQSAKQDASNASSSASDAAEQALSANESADVSEQHALMAESYTHGGTGLRENEAVDNAQYFLEQAKQLSQSMNGLIPMGTIAFADLSLTANQVEKYMFNISDDFTTDSTFKEGAGHNFPAGTNVFRTNDGYWDCLAGSFLTPNGDTKDNTVTFSQTSTLANINTGEKLSVIFGKIKKVITEFIALVDGVPTAFNTLSKIASAITDNKNTITSVNYGLSLKASQEDLGFHTENISNPHAVTKSQVGLGNVPNVSTNNQTPTYTQASTLTKLSSGEKLSVAFGKIAKAIADLITHLADAVKHITSEERAKWDGYETDISSLSENFNEALERIDSVENEESITYEMMMNSNWYDTIENVTTDTQNLKQRHTGNNFNTQNCPGLYRITLMTSTTQVGSWSMYMAALRSKGSHISKIAEGNCSFLPVLTIGADTGQLRVKMSSIPEGSTDYTVGYLVERIV